MEARTLVIGLCLTSCSVPELDDIRLAECMTTANDKARECIRIAKATFDIDYDMKAYVDRSESCAFTLIDDIAACVKTTQEELKQ